MKVSSITPKTWNGKDFVEVVLDGKAHSCWNNWKTLKVGDEVTGEVVDKGPGKTPQIKIATINGVAVEKSSGFKKQESKVESFACAYAKDIAVICVDKGILTSADSIKTTLDYFYSYFMEKMK